jgi:hypothetical protein
LIVHLIGAGVILAIHATAAYFIYEHFQEVSLCEAAEKTSFEP